MRNEENRHVSSWLPWKDAYAGGGRVDIFRPDNMVVTMCFFFGNGAKDDKSRNQTSDVKPGNKTSDATSDATTGNKTSDATTGNKRKLD